MNPGQLLMTYKFPITADQYPEPVAVRDPGPASINMS